MPSPLQPPAGVCAVVAPRSAQAEARLTDTARRSPKNRRLASVTRTLPDRAQGAPQAQPLAALAASLNSWVEVDLDRLAANVAALRGVLGPAVDLIAVVKADAYGAGVELLAPALWDAGVTKYAVVWVDEGIALRQILPLAEIIVLGHTPSGRAQAAVDAALTLTLDTLALANELATAAATSGKVAEVHIHIDSGLHRDGVTPDEGVALAAAVQALPGVEITGVSTHMANADEVDDHYSDGQALAFVSALDALGWARYRHAANSATALRRPELRFDGVRVGLALHGLVPENTPSAGLEPILSVHARLIRVTSLVPGDGVGYGLAWRAARPSRVGLIPVGYADGWKRSLAGAGEVLVRGRRCPMVGRVMMDQFVIDVTDVAGVEAGDEAVLLGSQGGDTISGWDVARAAGTIAWDITASLTGRLPRIAHRGGAVVETRGVTEDPVSAGQA